MAKLFTSILNNRLLDWSKTNDVITDAQFGFKPNCGTRDAIFALHSIVTNTLCKRKRLYCAFIDFKKAFDSIDRSKLWLKLSKVGIQGKLLNVIKALYNDVKSCVVVNGHLSDYFCNNVGLMQGEVLSPILFNLYVNDFEMNFLKSGCIPHELLSLNLFLLMYADDMVLFSESVEGLQLLLNELSHYCKTWNLCINVEKSKIVVFRNKGKIKCNEKWCIGNDALEIVEQFTYLGIIFQYNTKFTKAEKQLSDQGRKAMFAFRKNIRGMILNHETLLSLFDCYVGGIINYASEIWGSHKGNNVEKLHLDFCKQTLGVKRSSFNAAVYAELDFRLRTARSLWEEYQTKTKIEYIGCYSQKFYVLSSKMAEKRVYGI